MKRKILLMIMMTVLVLGVVACGAAAEKEKEVETWEDDYVIAFCDTQFTENVKKITGKSMDITYGDVKDIRDIGFYEWSPYTFNTLDSFKYFTSLEELCINVEGKDLRGLENLTNLTEIDIRRASNLTDISALANLKNLKVLEIEAKNLTDISVIYSLPSLEEVRINGEKIDINK